ncbi:hypothetical protein V8E53_010994 [Lactarius tabidus]
MPRTAEEAALNPPSEIDSGVGIGRRYWTYTTRPMTEALLCGWPRISSHSRHSPQYFSEDTGSSTRRPKSREAGHRPSSQSSDVRTETTGTDWVQLGRNWWKPVYQRNLSPNCSLTSREMIPQVSSECVIKDQHHLSFGAYLNFSTQAASLRHNTGLSLVITQTSWSPQIFHRNHIAMAGSSFWMLSILGSTLRQAIFHIANKT